MSLIAINILFEPDAATVERAKALNARLLGNYPQGFPLDQHHTPTSRSCSGLCLAT